MSTFRYPHLRPHWADWPREDQRLWEKAVQPKDYAFDTGGAFAHLRERSVELYAENGNRARQWAITRGYSKDALFADIWTPDLVREYPKNLRQSGSPDTTIGIRLTAIERITAATRPKRDRQYLLDEISMCSREPDREAMRQRMQSRRDVDTCAIALIEASQQDPDLPSAWISERTGVIIGLLNKRAYRLEALSLIEWWEQTPPPSTKSLYLIKERGTWWIRCNEDQSDKRKKVPEDQPFPKKYVEGLELYLAPGGPRQKFCERSGYAGRRLWVSDKGPLSGNAIYKQVISKTTKAFGVSINPHLFRSILATSLSAFGKPGDAHALLANTPPVVAKSYDFTTPTAAACLAVARLTDEFCRTGSMGSINDIETEEPDSGETE